MKNKKIVQIHWIGRFGNRMFQYAFGCTYSKMYGVHYYMPSEWEGSKLFEPFENCSIIDDPTLRLEVNQTLEALDTDSYRESAIERYNKKTNDNIIRLELNYNNKNLGETNTYFQSLHMMYDPMIFKNVFKNSSIKNNIFNFNSNVKNSKLYKFLSQIKKTYVVAHIRRGDIACENYVGAHSVVSLESYDKAYEKFGFNKLDVLIVSDDQILHNAYTKLNIPPELLDMDEIKKDIWFYPIGQTFIDNESFFNFFVDFLILYFAKVIFRSNSSFSWWASYLSDAEIYSPVLKKKPVSKQNSNYIQNCEFIKGNHKHFMGTVEDGYGYDIVFGDDNNNENNDNNDNNDNDAKDIKNIPNLTTVSEPKFMKKFLDLNKEWKIWTDENIKRGCAVQTIKNILIEQGFSINNANDLLFQDK